MNAVVKQEVAESNTVSMFERLARDPSVDVEKLQRLMDLQERAHKRDAESAFTASLAELQCELPSIGERGNAAGRYTYALWEDINATIKPILHKHGFALSFRTDFSDGIAVTAVLSHRNGHSERTSIKLPADKSGNKPEVQAVASSVSYGKRYTASALLNLTSHGEDDDAFRASGGGSDELRLATIEKLKESTSLEDMRTRYKALSKKDRASVTQADLDAIKANLQ